MNKPIDTPKADPETPDPDAFQRAMRNVAGSGRPDVAARAAAAEALDGDTEAGGAAKAPGRTVVHKPGDSRPSVGPEDEDRAGPAAPGNR